MQVLDLFSGMGGISLGLECAGMSTVAFVEKQRHLQPVLRENFGVKRVYGNIKRLSKKHLRRIGRVRVIAGGFPCQDISTAGKGAGLNGARSGLWWEMWRVICQSRPAWVFIENVPALRTRGADAVLTALEEQGYTCWAQVVGARHVGAQHQRDRAWIVGYSHQNDIWKQSEPFTRRGCAPFTGGTGEAMGDSESITAVTSQNVPDANSLACPQQEVRVEGRREIVEPAAASSSRIGSGGGAMQQVAPPGEYQFDWEQPRVIPAKSFVGTPTYGLSRGLALEACGNAVVPQVVECFGRAIIRLDALLETY